MKRTLLFLIILIAVACSEGDDTSPVCNVNNPIEELEWLRIELEESNFEGSTYLDAFVHQATYLGQPVFYISICCPVCDVAPPSVRQCDGTVVGSLGVDISSENLNHTQIIWRTDNGVCP